MRRAVIALAAFVAASPLIGSEARAQSAAVAPRDAASRVPGAPGQRARMERNLRQALWRATKERVGLTDEQMTRLDAVNRELEPRRAALLRRERESRRGLRQELLARSPDQDRVERMLGELQAVQRVRLGLIEEEQRRLAVFMTPVQRARYFALQEQFRRRLEQARRPGGPGGPGGPPDQREPGARRPPAPIP